MNNETFITVSLAEYKELLETKIRAEYDLKIKELEAQSKERAEQANYWFDRFCKVEKALNDANAEISVLKKAGVAENG